MKTGHALRVRQCRGNGRDGERRCIGCERHFRSDYRLEFAKQRLFDIEVFDDRFDDEFATGKRLYRASRTQTSRQAIGLGSVESPFVTELFPLRDDGRLGPFGRAFHAVEQHNLAAGLRGHLGDAAPHGARSDNPDFRKSRLHLQNVLPLKCCPDSVSEYAYFWFFFDPFCSYIVQPPHSFYWGLHFSLRP